MAWLEAADALRALAGAFFEEWSLVVDPVPQADFGYEGTLLERAHPIRRLVLYASAIGHEEISLSSERHRAPRHDCAPVFLAFPLIDFDPVFVLRSPRLRDASYQSAISRHLDLSIDAPALQRPRVPGSPETECIALRVALGLMPRFLVVDFAAYQDATDAELIALSKSLGRPRVAVSRLYREEHFRYLVLNAYGWRCALCEISLGLVEAAHINPVAAQGSTDEVSNGIALCALHHRAFDAELFDLDPDSLEVRFNSAEIERLRAAGKAAGWEEFVAMTAPVARIPLDHSLRPSRANLARRSLRS